MSYEPGKYQCVTNVAALVPAGTGTPQVVIEIYPTHGVPVHGDPFPVQGPPRRIYLSLTSATLGTPDRPGWVANALACLGFVGDFADLSCLSDKTVIARMEMEPGRDGKVREKWNLILNDRPLEGMMNNKPPTH